MWIKLNILYRVSLFYLYAVSKSKIIIEMTTLTHFNYICINIQNCINIQFRQRSTVSQMFHGKLFHARANSQTNVSRLKCFTGVRSGTTRYVSRKNCFTGIRSGTTRYVSRLKCFTGVRSGVSGYVSPCSGVCSGVSPCVCMCVRVLVCVFWLVYNALICPVSAFCVSGGIIARALVTDAPRAKPDRFMTRHPSASPRLYFFKY